MSTATVSIATRVTPDVQAQFYALAKARGFNPARVVRDLIDAWIECEEAREAGR